ncbi:MAG: hypothetical protein RLO81_10100 [Fulvivirga sp.]|uniref:hypothetical protein n=1 Tax=Fulvivirga sp. TaxID=1931237 RepID=UPI0032ECEDFA
MSNKDLDSLFKNKLEDYEHQPAKDLWSSIDAQLPQKSTKPKYWLLGIAASLLLLVGVAIGFYISHTEIEQNQQQLANQTKDIEKTELIEESKTDASSEISDNDLLAVIEPNEKMEETPVKTIEKKAAVSSSIKTEHFKSNVEQPIAEEKVEEITPLPVETRPLELIAEKNIEPLDISNATAAANKASEKQDVSSTIVFDIKEFTKENTTVLASANEEKKESKLKQLLNIAKDIKEGESGLSELREAKNDLFALNSKKNEKGR